MRFLTCCLFIFCLAVPSFIAQAQDTDTVSIVGAVQLGGQFKVKESLSLIDALKMAHGFTPSANRHAIEITHNGTTRIVDFDPMAMGKAAMVQIEAGDTVRVPNQARRRVK
jgi:protein involved in polysaccharide export with SLBB domain